MKKLLILCLLAMLAVPLVYAQCTDIDGGVTCNNQFYSDYCESTSTGGQYANIRICKNVTYQDCALLVGVNRVLCPYGCKDGACIQQTTTCTDSDGGANYYIKGSTKLSDSSGLNDDCTGDYTAMTPGILLEAVCDGNSQKHITYVCPYGCKDGACIQQSINCTDSDGGKNYYTKGVTKGVDSQGNPITEEDNCGFTVYDNQIDYNYLNEFYCSSAIVYGTQYKCPNGCKDGACIQQTTTCTDSDNGKDYYTEGKGTGPYGNEKQLNVVWGEDPNKCSARWDYNLDTSIHYDCCLDSATSNQLNEAYCDNGILHSTAFHCPYGCKNGACIQSTQPVGCNNNSICDSEDHSLYVGSSATYKGLTIRLENVGSQGEVVVDVNGVKETLVALIPEVVNGVPIKVKTATYNPSKEGRSAVLTFGENSYLCGDCTNNPECFDSDNGQSYYELGTVIERTQYSKWEPNIFSDMCSTDSPQGNLAEAICKKSSDGYYYGSQVFFNCPLGCKDGVCLTNETTCSSAADNCCLPEDDMICDNDCSTGEDHDCVECTSKAGDCCLSESDGICDTDCQTEEDPDCKEIGCNKNGVCELSRKENSGNCPEDCYCGDGICDPVEKPKKCQEDCGYCTPEWECHLEPATCPEEGIQNKVCIDTKCGSEDSRIEALKCLSGTCSGCLSEGTCYPVTTRMLLGEIPNYCDVTKTFANQKDLGAPCQNNYECLSNECSDGECISIKKQLEETQSLLKKILDWLKNIF